MVVAVVVVVVVAITTIATLFQHQIFSKKMKYHRRCKFKHTHTHLSHIINFF